MSLTLTGQGFGQKTTPAPVVWDDSSGSNIHALWSGAWPNASANPVYNTGYVAAPFRNISAPHGRTNRMIAGAHGENTGAYSGYNVMVFKAVEIGSLPANLYASWYQRADDRWVFGGDNNFKMFNYSKGSEPYAQANSWMLIWGPPHPDNAADNCQWLIGDDGKSLANPDINGNTAWWKRGVNPMSGVWSKVEVAARLTSASDGYVNVWQDGLLRVAYAGPTDKMAGTLRTIAVGGFARIDAQPNNWRYFTDIYIDTSLARVVLANHPTLPQATLVETQIPQAWSDGSITVQANLGRFTNGQKAYLFVVDAAGNASKGYPIAVNDSGSSSQPPASSRPNSPKLTVQ
jgi:hypothetical protein